MISYNPIPFWIKFFDALVILPIFPTHRAFRHLKKSFLNDLITVLSKKKYSCVYFQLSEKLKNKPDSVPLPRRSWLIWSTKIFIFFVFGRALIWDRSFGLLSVSQKSIRFSFHDFLQHVKLRRNLLRCHRSVIDHKFFVDRLTKFENTLREIWVIRFTFCKNASWNGLTYIFCVYFWTWLINVVSLGFDLSPLPQCVLILIYFISLKMNFSLKV